MEKPGAALYIGKTELLKRLVPCAGEFLSIFQNCGEAELARLCGVDVKKGDRITEDIPGFPVGYRDQENLRPNQIAELLLKSQTAERLDGFHQAVMAVNGKGSLVGSLFHLRSDHAYHPHNAENVVCVLMSDKNMMNLCERNLHLIQDAENTVSAAGVHHKKFCLSRLCLRLDGKACIIAMSDSSVSCAEHIQLLAGKTGFMFHVHRISSLRTATLGIAFIVKKLPFFTIIWYYNPVRKSTGQNA